MTVTVKKRLTRLAGIIRELFGNNLGNFDIRCYRTRSKFCGFNFRVAPSNCIRGSLSSWGTNFRGRGWGGFARYLATCCGLIFVDNTDNTDSWGGFARYTVCVEIFEVYKFSWISWYTPYPRKLIHNK